MPFMVVLAVLYADLDVLSVIQTNIGMRWIKDSSLFLLRLFLAGSIQDAIVTTVHKRGNFRNET